MATRFQQLGAFVGEASKVSDERLDRFAQIGGRWVIVLLAQLGYSDDHDPSCVRNLADIEGFKGRCVQRGIACGGWFNGWAGGQYSGAPEGGLGTTAAQDADKVAEIVKGHNLGPVVLDLEAAYQYPVGVWNELPKLLWETRQRIKTRSIAVSTNSPNDSMIWNGGQLGRKASMAALSVRLMPQWYNAPAYGHGPWMRPDQTMQWLQQHGMEDNLHDPQGPSGRAIPLSFVHGTLEVTGLEGADLAGELDELETAKAVYGYTSGFSIYLLEDMPDSDFGLIASKRGRLFLT